MSVRRVVSSQEMQGKNKAMITFKIYEQHWRRFRKWLSSNGHGRFLIDGKDLFERRQLFASIKLPLSVPIFEDYLTFGGYPGSYQFIQTKDWADYVRNSIISTVIEKDILQNPAIIAI
jgi:predicted AAA+ superfamily ATPase